jgi:hypothetical protein|tara:strand:- start:187 stop:495 length:309 start_codon:yes stop_codon:yes gene_type:complete
MFTPKEWIIALIISLSCGILWYLADLYDAWWATKHMGYSKDEWEGFTALRGFTPHQIQDTCDYLGRPWPMDDNEWEADIQLVTARRLGHWVTVDTSTEKGEA